MVTKSLWQRGSLGEVGVTRIAPRRDGLVLWLPLYRQQGDTIYSEEGRRQLFTVTGTLWTPQGRIFDPTDDSIDCGNNSAILNFTAQTILFWVKTSLSANVRDAMDSGYATGNGYRFYFAENERNIYAMLRNGGEISQTEAIAYSDNTWAQIGLNWDGTTLWPVKNGVRGTSTPHAGATASGANLFLGRRADADLNHWDGTMGEVLIWNRALSAAGLQQNYAATKWRFQ